MSLDYEISSSVVVVCVCVCVCVCDGMSRVFLYVHVCMYVA